METLRDTAFGKLVRLVSGYRWMQYPEERDASMWTEYLKTETEKTEEEPSMPVIEDENSDDLEAFGLYTVRSQLSSRSRRMSSASTIHDGGAGPSSSQPLVISWRGPEDSEVPISNANV
jgi:DHA1 family multidrug resistance protein-like MFS transporter